MPIFPPSGMRRASLLQNISPQTTKPIFVPAPNRGINSVDGLAEMAPSDAIFMYNMLPSQYGVRVRTGYREWVTDVGNGVFTIIPFTGGSTSKLFAASDDGIYDVSASGTSPAAEISFPIVDANSGIGTWSNYVNDNGDFFGLYWDESNGYYVYTAGTDTWAKVAMGAGATEVDNVDPNDLVFGTIFKNRVWMIERGTGNAWYLAAGSIYGAATKFNFGNKFPHGGTLVGLYRWTVDGGEGVDDYLVAIGSGGDVVVFKGTDPATATSWFEHGKWFIGPPPAGRRIAGSFGGELYLLSAYGLLPMSKLMSGTLVQMEEIYLSKKITPLINTEMLSTRTTIGWEVRLIPTENVLIISSPKRVAFDYTQFAYSLNTPGWGVFRDIPYFTGDTWDGAFYIGTEDGRVLLHTGNLDNLSLDESTSEEISWSVLQSFQDVGQPGIYHRTQFIRPVFLSAAVPEYSVEARYDYNLSEVLPPPSSGISPGGLWDDPTSLWDFALWGGEFAIISDVKGGSGLGRAISVGLNGLSSAETILIRYDLMADSGGML